MHPETPTSTFAMLTKSAASADLEMADMKRKLGGHRAETMNSECAFRKLGRARGGKAAT
jgi:hypothetical protein